jgi:hypothetical protein
MAKSEMNREVFNDFIYLCLIGTEESKKAFDASLTDSQRSEIKTMFGELHSAVLTRWQRIGREEFEAAGIAALGKKFDLLATAALQMESETAAGEEAQP